MKATNQFGAVESKVARPRQRDFPFPRPLGKGDLNAGRLFGGCLMKAIYKITLTEAKIKKVKGNGNLTRLYDVACPGLAQYIYRSGYRSWKLHYVFAGRARVHNLGPLLLEDARRLGFKLLAMKAEGIDPIGHGNSVSVPVPFAVVHQRYVEEHAKRRNKSWQQADKLIKRHILPRWGGCDATSITRADARAMLKSIAAPIAANLTMASVSAVFRWAIREEIVTVNPVADLEFNPTKDRERKLSDDEIRKIWPLMSPPLRVLLLCGQRKSEVSCMRFEHLSCPQGGHDAWWDLPGLPVPELGWPGVKNGRSHRVPLSQAVQELIFIHSEQNSRTGFVFPKVGDLDREMRRICAKLNIERAVPHDLRRTWASTAGKLGCDEKHISRLLNHSDGSDTAIYNLHRYDAEKREIMEVVAEHIKAVALCQKQE
jgi:integrase